MNIVKHIPNSITSLNLLCGAIGVVFATKGQFGVSFLFMLAGAAFDFCDGLSARTLNAYSPMGKELDSLADDVTFGLLPGIMLFEIMRCGVGMDNALCWVPLLIPVFSGLRLAKFNIDERQGSSFIGLPTPACAMICGSLACFVSADCASPVSEFILNPWFIPSLSVILSLLLVSEIPMFSFKFHKGDKLGWKRLTFIIVAVISLIIVPAMKWNAALIVLFSFTAYIIINLIGIKKQ